MCAMGVSREIESRVSCLCITGSRGKGPNALLLDELSHIPSATIRKGLLPIVMKKGTSWVSGTTPEGKDNHVSRMLQLHRDGVVSVFWIIDTSLACPDCLRLEDPSQCTHKLNQVAKWKDTSRIKQFRMLFPEHREEYTREVFGVQMDNEGPVFDAVVVDRLFAKNRPRMPKHPKRIVVAIDPAGGSLHGISEHAIIGMVYTQKKHTLISIDVQGGRNSLAIKSMLLDHIEQLHNHPDLSGAEIVIIMESNSSYLDADEMNRMIGLRGLHRCRMLEFNGNRGRNVHPEDPAYGVRNGSKEKYSMAKTTIAVLASDALEFVCNDDIISRNPVQCMDKLHQQFLKYNAQPVPNKQHRPVWERFKFSGKPCDDAVTTLQMSEYHTLDRHLRHALV